MLRNPLLVPDLRELIQAGEIDALGEFFADHHPVQIAELIEDLDVAEGDVLIKLLAPRVRGDVMSYLTVERQVEIVNAMPPSEAAALLHLMPHDDRADLVNHLEEEQVDAIFPHLAQAEREDIRRLASYEPGTAGGVMTTDYVTLAPHLTVRESLDRVRREAPDRETIEYSYVVDESRKLLGIVSLKRLILARPQSRITEIMQRDPILARVDDDQESVARTIDKYDLFAIPVVDATGMLVGIVTHDDAMDILRREQTEDILAFGGVTVDPEVDDIPYWQGSVYRSVRRRVNWLLLLFLAETLTGSVSRHYEWVEEASPHLHHFTPLLIGTGGNAGSQAVGTIIRGLALGEIVFSQTMSVVFREWITGTVLGLILGAVGFLHTWLLRGESPTFALVIAFTILGICMWANTVGALVPLLARKLGIDPAVVSAPLITTLVDATGLCIFYTIAILLLRIT